jgi:hypothetical protein
MRQSGSGIAWQGFSQVRLSHLTCHPASCRDLLARLRRVPKL